MSFENIPRELQTHRQWVCHDSNKVPLNPRTGEFASVTNSQSWGTFEEACSGVEAGKGVGIGFVLTNEDPYAFIDLDDTKGDAVEQEKQVAIFEEFDSYAEKSPSGKGLHIIIKGAIPVGKRKGKVEIYSFNRYMTMTGCVYRNKPISDHSVALLNLWARMGGEASQKQNLNSSAQDIEDSHLIERAYRAKNGEKFKLLYEGRWKEHYQSQSEADQALINIIAFYSKNIEQITRIFHGSALGVRAKARRKDYLEIMIMKALDNDLVPINVNLSQNLKCESKKISRYSLLSEDDFNRMQPIEWRIKGILPAKGFAVVYGASGSGKSFLVIDMAYAIAEGRQWFGISTKAAKTLYVGLEGQEGVRGRVLAQKAFAMRAMPSDMRVTLPSDFMLTTVDDVSDLAEICPQNCVIFIDTLNRAAPEVDENSSRDMGRVIEGVKRLQQKINGLVVIVAHSGKNAAAGLRGHSSLYAAADAVIEVRRNQNSRSWKVDKSKDGEDGKELNFSLRIVEIGLDEDGIPITSCVVQGGSNAGSDLKRKMTLNQKVGMDSFIESANKYGEIDKSNGLLSVHLNKWRPEFYRISPADTDAAKKKAFERVRKDLIELGCVTVENNIYKLVGGDVHRLVSSLTQATNDRKDKATRQGQHEGGLFVATEQVGTTETTHL